jgi:transposase
VRSEVEWAEVRAMVADGVGQREIARRLGINRRTVKRLAEASESPRYERAPAGSMLDRLEPVIRGLLKEWPGIKAPRMTELLRDDYGYGGSVDLVRKWSSGQPNPARRRTSSRPTAKIRAIYPS